jgi:hypothetical protein
MSKWSTVFLVANLSAPADLEMGCAEMFVHNMIVVSTVARQPV